jgi:hypothetical protein
MRPHERPPLERRCIVTKLLDVAMRISGIWGCYCGSFLPGANSWGMVLFAEAFQGSKSAFGPEKFETGTVRSILEGSACLVAV